LFGIISEGDVTGKSKNPFSPPDALLKNAAKRLDDF
jgi:hypothetical protein